MKKIKTEKKVKNEHEYENKLKISIKNITE